MVTNCGLSDTAKKAIAGYLYGERSIACKEESIPSVVYSHPNVAQVGFTEKKAREQGLTIEVRRGEYAANIIARTELRGNGFVKAIFCEDKLVGATIVGDDASELISAMSLAIANSLGKKELKQWIIPHPTLSEIFHGIS